MRFSGFGVRVTALLELVRDVMALGLLVLGFVSVASIIDLSNHDTAAGGTWAVAAALSFASVGVLLTLKIRERRP